MLEHGLQRTRIGRSQELEEPAGDLEAVHVSHPAHVQQDPLQRCQPAASVVHPLLPQPASRVQHVEVRHVVERGWHAVECPTCFHHRQVECFAVVRDDQVGVGEQLGGSAQKGALRAVAREQELPDLERASIEVPAAHEECHRTSASAEPCGFEIQKDCAGRRAIRPAG